jgi:futalosine hydrolase
LSIFHAKSQFSQEPDLLGSQKLRHDKWTRMAKVATLVCTATEFEATLLRERLGNTVGIRLVTTGVGVVNAAHAVTLAISTDKPGAIVVCGVGGAYPSSGLRIGDVASAETEVYGDLGADSPTGFLDMKALGLPVVVTPSSALYNDLPLQLFPTERRVRFVTVSTCTGTRERAQSRESRTRGAVENMEGAAIAHVAHLHGIPVGEVRGISNIATDRDRGSWQLKDAAEAAQVALISWLSGAR